MAPRKKLHCPYCPNKVFRSDNLKRHMSSFRPQMSNTVSSPTLSPSQHTSSEDNSAQNQYEAEAQITEQSKVVIQVSRQQEVQHSTIWNQRLEYPGELAFTMEVVDIDNATPNFQEKIDGTIQAHNIDDFLPEIDPDICAASVKDESHKVGCSQCWLTLECEREDAITKAEYLLGATQEKNSALMQHLIGLHVSTQYRDPVGDTALHHVVNAKQINTVIVGLLCKEGSSLNMSNRGGDTPLILACKRFAGLPLSACERLYTEVNSVLATIKILLQAGADPNITDIDHKLPLHRFTWHNLSCYPEEEVRHCLHLLASKTKNVDAPNGSRTCLSAAAECNDAALVEILLKHGADPSFYDRDSDCPLARATGTEVARCLIDAWPGSIDPSNKVAREILESRILGREYEIVELTSKRNPLLIPRLDAENAPLLFLIWDSIFASESESKGRRYRTCKVLLEAGCNPNRRGSKEETAFHLLANYIQSPDPNSLRSNLKGITNECIRGEWSVQSSTIHTAILLKEYGADINAIDSIGQTPLGVIIGSLVDHRQAARICSDNHLYDTDWRSSDLEALGSLIHTLQNLGAMLTSEEWARFEAKMLPYASSPHPLTVFIISTIKSCKVF